MQIQHIANDISVIIGDQYSSTSTVSLADDEALFVDAMGSTRDAEPLRNYVEQDLGKRTLNLFHNPGDSMSATGIEVPEGDLLFTADALPAWRRRGDGRRAQMSREESRVSPHQGERFDAAR